MLMSGYDKLLGIYCVLKEGLTEEVRNSLVTVSSMLSEVEQQQQQQSQRNIVVAEGSGCVGEFDYHRNLGKR